MVVWIPDLCCIVSLSASVGAARGVSYEEVPEIVGLVKGGGGGGASRVCGSGTNNNPNKNVTYGRRPRLEEQRGLAKPLLARGEVWHFAEVFSPSLPLSVSFFLSRLSPLLPRLIFAAKPP